MITVKRKNIHRISNSGKRSEQAQVNAIVRASTIVNPEPPMFQPSHHYVQKFRFTSQLPVESYPINPSDLANLLLVAMEDIVGVSQAFSAAPVYTRYLLKKVEMWALPTSLTAPVTLILSPQNSGTTSVNTEQTLSDTSKSIDRYAYVKYKPRLTSPIAQYQTQTSTGGGFRITCPGTTVVDVTLHVWVCNGEQPDLTSIWIGASGPAAAISAGAVFLAALDPSATGTSIFFPVGYLNPYTNYSDPTPRP